MSFTEMRTFAWSLVLCCCLPVASVLLIDLMTDVQTVAKLGEAQQKIDKLSENNRVLILELDVCVYLDDVA